MNVTMQSLLEVLNKSADYLQKKGVERPRLNAELIMAHALSCKRLDLYLKYDQPLAQPVLDRLRELIVRRGKREPLQYIVGTTDFFNVILKTDRRALIPRPETEEMISMTVAHLKKAPSSIIDLGTGSGAIALALARHYPDAHVVAIDASESALSLARENAEALGIKNVSFECVSWDLFKGKSFDLVIANPPYLTVTEWQSASPEVKDYEPYGALVSENNGIEDLLKILAQAKHLLSADGLLVMETGINHHGLLLKEAHDAGFSAVESRKDFAGHDRYFFASR
jgi:release factor glutamine methyltransferase